MTGPVPRSRPRTITLDSALLVLLASCLIACDGEETSEQRPMVRDSAGVQIVESSSPQWQENDVWRLSDYPDVEIGLSDGPSALQLFHVQDVRRRADGNVLVVNAGTQEVRLYSPSGAYIRTIGRSGSGPGEFRSPRRLWLDTHDSIIVADLDRLLIFDSAGTFVRSHAFSSAYSSYATGDATYLRLVLAPNVNPVALGYNRPDFAIVRFTADGTPADTLTQVSGSEVYRTSPTGREVYSYSAPFGAQRMIAVHSRSVFTGDGKIFEVRQLDERGTLRRILRRSGEPQPVTAEAIALFEQSMLQLFQIEEQRVLLRQLFQEWSYPDTQPEYDRLVIDRPGNVWIRHFHVEPEDSTAWTIFNNAGWWLGDLSLPAALEVKDIGDHYLLGVWTDDLGVEQVRQYRIEKPSA